MASKTLQTWIGAALIAIAQWTVAAPVAHGNLVVVQIGPLTTHVLPEVIELGQGMRAMFASANAKVGLRGNKIDFVQLDDGGDPQRYLQRFDEAVKMNALAVLTPYSSPTIQTLLGSGALERTDMVVMNPVPGADVFRKAGHPNLFHVRAGDGQQIDRIIRHVRTLGLTRLGVMYVDAPGGVSGLASTHASAQAAGSLSVTGFKAGREHPSMAAAASQLVASDSQGVVIFGPPTFLVGSIAALREAGYSRAVFSVSYLTPDDLAMLAPGQARGIGIAQAYPNPMGIVTPLQREFRAAMKAAFPTIDRYTSFQLEGFVSAKVLVQASRRSKRPTTTMLARNLRSMGETDLGGFRVDFSHGNVGSAYVDIAVVNVSGRLTY